MDTRNSPSFSESILQTLLLSPVDKDFNSSELSDHAPFHSCLQNFKRCLFVIACNESSMKYVNILATPWISDFY